MGGISSFVGNVAGAVGDVVGGAADVVEDVAGGVGDVVDDVWDTASDVVEDAWENDLVKTAAIAAGAYYGASYFFPETMASAKAAIMNPFTPTATSTVGGTVYTSMGPGAVEIASGGGLLSTATAATAAAASSSLLGAAKQIGISAVGGLAGQMLASAYGQGGGGGAGFAPVRLNKGAATTYGDFRARATELGINADVADGMMKVANSDLEAIQQFRRDVNRTATLGPTIELGSAQLGGIGVRSTTRDIS